MVEATAQKKNGEQYPLLMVAGAGDAMLRPPPALPEPIWSTSVIPERRSWRSNWPEYFSTCWMTCILLAISFLVFYGVGMVMVYRHDSYVLVKCNETQSTKQVFYHFVVPRGDKDPLKGNSNYLSVMAMRYPRLRFKVYILIDDSDQNNLSLYEKMGGTICAALDSNEIDYLRKLPNVNISIMPLSKFMNMTPLKKKWRDIPIEYIPFYARVFSVWMHGGVGLDLDTLGNQGQHSECLARVNKKIDAILTQHSNEISFDKYEETLIQLARDDKFDLGNDFFSNIVMKIIDDTMSVFNQSFGFNGDPPSNIESRPVQLSEPLVRTHRAKRDLGNETNTTPETNSTDQIKVIDIILSNSTVLNVTKNKNGENFYNISPNNDIANNIKIESNTAHENDPIMRAIGDEIAFIFNKTGVVNMDKNKSQETEILFFYDLSIIPESASPLRHVPRSVETKNKNTQPIYLTIDAEGIFVASTTNMHYFLGYLLTTGCKRLPPKYAIQNALTSYCSGQYRNMVYCNSIYVL